MTTFTLPATSGLYYRTPTHTGSGHYLTVNFGNSSGAVVVGVLYYGDDAYTNIDTVYADTTLTLAGRIEEFRFEFDLDSEQPNESITLVHIPATNVTTLPSHLQAGPVGYERLRVDNGEAGFFAARQFARDHQFTIPNGGQFSIKFTINTDTIVLLSSLSITTGSVIFGIYPASVITENTPFTVNQTMFNLNTQSSAPAYTRQNLMQTGGTVTIGGGADPYPLIELATANATAQRVGVGGSTATQRGIAGGTVAYAVFRQIPGTTGDTRGVYSLKLEERDWRY